MNPHWTKKQQARARACITAGDTLAYWCSDAWGRPTNGGDLEIEPAAPGVIHTAPGTALCRAGTLHATHEPHRWAGVRVWVAACRGIVGTEGDKLGCREREILGEILPGEAIDQSVRCRLGARDANLSAAYLGGANLRRTDLGRANLSRAYLGGANLRAAYLRRADLSDANLSAAYLGGANLRAADLRRANLGAADLGGADLRDANLGGANLGGANLGGANLRRTDLSGAYRPENDLPGWRANAAGYLEKIS